MYLALMVWAWIRIVSGPDLSQSKQNALFWKKQRQQKHQFAVFTMAFAFQASYGLGSTPVINWFIDSFLHL